MFSCPNCGYKTETAADFCPVCGARMVNEAAAAAAPTYGAPAYGAPAYGAPTDPMAGAPAYGAPAYGAPADPMAGAPVYAVPEAPVATAGASKGKAIAGGIIAIAGFGLAVIDFLVTIITLASGVYSAAFFVALYFLFFALPLSIVGFVLCKGCVNSGTTVGVAKIGKTLGLVGLIVSCACLGLGLISFTFNPYDAILDAAYDYYY